ncbi:hypothetical protein FZC76_09420 [Sutcliffiella horikoshii]|uniref:Uncharacterized protein n=1 Tax=Sutcliffiella horikoshii TaxID=79883 RepID=A0A5D4T4R5_9BACI|nr:hypothetical protein [Sutcliffiella horikoshii]TYS69134.1 hypothetical protein FZC76_09420 [Sutcliffiella horikoshii]
MKEVWISEDGDFSEIEGDGFYRFYLYRIEDVDYQEENKQLLLDFIGKLNIFPLNVLVEGYDEEEKMRRIFEGLGFSYSVDYFTDKRMYSTGGKNFTYHPPFFQIEASSIEELQLIMTETYHLATQNQFYGISFKNIVQLISRNGYSFPKLCRNKDIAALKVSHDGQGFNFYSNMNSLQNMEQVINMLPQGYVVTQINDCVIEK